MAGQQDLKLIQVFFHRVHRGLQVAACPRAWLLEFRIHAPRFIALVA